jgi:acetoin utilization protein AcuC
VLRAHQPSVLVTQHGCDSHRQDPLADLNLSLDGQRASYLALASLADELCAGRWVSTGGGGYSVLNVVPRAWTHLLGIVSGQPVDPSTPVPESWRAEVGESAPLTMSDGADASFRPFDGGFAPHSRVDQAILATRRAVFPELGLDPSL